ncbi:protein kinase [Streptomyces malaysiensis]
MTSGGDDVRLIAGRYQLGNRLGRGGMGTVWRAYDEMLAREVAAKELHVASDDREHHRRMRRALREARTVARVHHPHVVGIHDLVEHDDRLWIVMELVDGPSLARRIADTGPLTPRHTAALGLQLLGALEAVHAAGALHRDIKPANILLRQDGGAVLTDFGIAALEDDESLTTTGELLGSIGYMAPERLTDEEVGPPSDLWSLGATLSAVASGVPPFQRPTGAAALHAVTFADPVIPEQVGPLRPIVEALLNKSPGQRPSAATVGAALRRVADGADDPGPLPPAGPRRGLRRRRVRPGPRATSRGPPQAWRTPDAGRAPHGDRTPDPDRNPRPDRTAHPDRNPRPGPGADRRRPGRWAATPATPRPGPHMVVDGGRHARGGGPGHGPLRHLRAPVRQRRQGTVSFLRHHQGDRGRGPRLADRDADPGPEGRPGDGHLHHRHLDGGRRQPAARRSARPHPRR